MEIYESTERTSETPTRSELKEMRDEGDSRNLVATVLRWKGETDEEYFEEVWDLTPSEIHTIARDLEEEDQIVIDEY